LAECLPLALAHHRDQHRDRFLAQSGRGVAVVAEPGREGRFTAWVLQIRVVLDREPGPLPEALPTVKRDEDVELRRRGHRLPSLERFDCGTPVEISVENECERLGREDDLLAPVLADFFTAETDVTVPGEARPTTG
jgi:hypothetical protein